MQPTANPAGSKKGPFGSPVYWTQLWTNKEIHDLFDTSYSAFRDYLWLSRNTESPRQYHLWSLISLTATLMSNNSFVNRGIGGRLKLNMGVVLTGRAAIRKSSAIGFMQRFASSLNVNYGPTDTGGARHGIMAAMQSRWQDDIKDTDELAPASLSELGLANFDTIIARMERPRTRPSAIYFASKELGRLLTAQTRELLDFFNDGLDGEPIHYKTKTGDIRIPAPLINLLGATTPGNLPSILPRDSHDHGLLSRLIFVYAGRSADSVPIPPAISTHESMVQTRLTEQLHRVSLEATGEIAFDAESEAEYRRLYEYAVPTLEFRLNAYTGRRAEHLAKLAAIICLLRAEAPYRINIRDLGLAHTILILTEVDMDGAYMNMGKGIDDRAYTLIREVLESTESVIDRAVLYGHMNRAGFLDDDCTKILERLLKAKKLDITDGNRIRLGLHMGGEKAQNYLNNLYLRLQVPEQEMLTNQKVQM